MLMYCVWQISLSPQMVCTSTQQCIDDVCSIKMFLVLLLVIFAKKQFIMFIVACRIAKVHKEKVSNP